ncbi:hypothetical protein F2P81_005172 [Scophthalmus maximus]|uniref:Uncharacterized protein n=1 Tax=Scophthalmus maximus TaxID=52904 RepID=A0A6A4TCV2_SCOMX|nr:hypothetical protein F2P81_005172 [Scophthalmus maximus]
MCCDFQMLEVCKSSDTFREVTSRPHRSPSSFALCPSADEPPPTRHSDYVEDVEEGILSALRTSLWFFEEEEEESSVSGIFPSASTNVSKTNNGEKCCSRLLFLLYLILFIPARRREKEKRERRLEAAGLTRPQRDDEDDDGTQEVVCLSAAVKPSEEATRIRLHADEPTGPGSVWPMDDGRGSALRCSFPPSSLLLLHNIFHLITGDTLGRSRPISVLRRWRDGAGTLPASSSLRFAFDSETKQCKNIIMKNEQCNSIVASQTHRSLRA